MKVSLLQENLDQALKTVSKAVPSKPQLPILGSVLLSVANGEVFIAATDLYLGARVRVPASVIEEGTIAIPAKVFIDTIHALSPGKISLEASESTLTITSEKTSSTLQLQVADEFPSFPEKEGAEIEFKRSQLEEIDTLLGFAAATDQARLVLTTLLFRKSGDDLDVVSTDGFRLGVLKLATQTLPAELSEVLIPAKALNEIVRVAETQDQENISFMVSEELKQLFFTLKDTELYVRLVEGQFPPYEKILPTEFATSLTIDADSLLQHLKQAQIFARDSSNIVRLELSPEKIMIKARSTAHGEFAAEVAISDVSGPTTETIAFNARYLQDFLTKVKPKTVWFGMNDALKPAVFKTSADDHYQYIVMPFRVNE